MLGYLLGVGIYGAMRGSGPVAHTYEETEGRANAMALQQEMAALREEIATMALVNKVLVRTLMQKSVCTPQEFEALFHQIDLEDGTADGRSTEPKMRMCPKCGKRLPMRRSICMYCGEDAGKNITL